MQPTYPDFTPKNLRYRCCPICASQLEGMLDEEGIARTCCTSCGWTHFPCNVQTAMVVITTPEGVVFLLDDAPQESVAFLPGGIVEYGETPEEAAIREAREETGLQVEIVRTLKRVFFQDFPFGPTLSFIFEARKVGGELREGLEGHPAVFQEREFPVITPARKGSQAALAAYLESKQQSVDPGALTVVAQWRE